MAIKGLWSIGVDLGGTKVEMARVDGEGKIDQRMVLPTDVRGGPSTVKAQIIAAIRDIENKTDSRPVGVGIGVAGQIDAQQGVVRFAPNLGWHDVSLQSDLSQAVALPVVITNDVRAATWGEWIHGAGKGSQDLVCLFVGTGIGGGVVSGGQMLSGCSNTAGELGHITINLNGLPCHCGNKGCLEACAGGWAIARRAQEAIRLNPVAGVHMLNMVDGQHEAVNAKIVAQSSREGDPLAQSILDEVFQALLAGTVSIVNAFNPCRLILGGGVIEGLPELIYRIARGIHQLALEAASGPLQVLPAQLHNDAGVIGAASLAMQLFTSENK
ncbi:MAG TPA: ROK family protein [Nitrospiraceae bacterium]|jgi:glucokinase|nr:ROK family protein [Nitrospiraceae bacterium]